MKKKKNSVEYWEKRTAKTTWKVYNSIEEKNRDLIDFYTKASKEIREELYRIGEKYSRNGALTLSDLHKQNRLKKLNERLNKIIKELGKQVQQAATGRMQKGFKEVYENACKSVGNINFAQPNKKLMDKLLNEPWRGSEFSSRLWRNQRALSKALNSALLIGLQQGKTLTEIAVAVHSMIGNGFNNVHRLVRTETMHYLNNAALRGYLDSGVTHVRIWAARDERTCKHCMEYHSKVYPIGKVPILPLHPHCRCTYLPLTDPEEIAEAL